MQVSQDLGCRGLEQLVRASLPGCVSQEACSEMQVSQDAYGAWDQSELDEVIDRLVS